MGAHLVRNEGVAGSSPAGSTSSTDQRRACTRHGTSPRRHLPRRRWACTRWRFAGRGGTARSPCAGRACSASGSAPRWHRGGSGFDPRQVHGFAAFAALQQGADRFRPGRLIVRVEPGKVTSPRQHAWHQEAPTASTSPPKGGASPAGRSCPEPTGRRKQDLPAAPSRPWTRAGTSSGRQAEHRTPTPRVPGDPGRVTLVRILFGSSWLGTRVRLPPAPPPAAVGRPSGPRSHRGARTGSTATTARCRGSRLNSDERAAERRPACEPGGGDWTWANW